MTLQWRGGGPYLLRQLYEPMGCLWRGKLVAVSMGWDRSQSLTILDRDGLAIAGFVPNGEQPTGA